MLGVNAAEKIQQNKRDLEVELIVILYRLTLIEEVIFEQRIEGSGEEETGISVERTFPVRRNNQCKVSKVGACLMPLGNSKQASVVGVK